jgi:hypothetical protein
MGLRATMTTGGPRHSSGGQSPASHRCGPGSNSSYKQFQPLLPWHHVIRDEDKKCEIMGLGRKRGLKWQIKVENLCGLSAIHRSLAVRLAV